MDNYRITYYLKKHLAPHIRRRGTDELEASTILEALVLALTKNEYIDIPDITKIELIKNRTITRTKND